MKRLIVDTLNEAMGKMSTAVDGAAIAMKELKNPLFHYLAHRSGKPPTKRVRKRLRQGAYK